MCMAKHRVKVASPCSESSMIRIRMTLCHLHLFVLQQLSNTSPDPLGVRARRLALASYGVAAGSARESEVHTSNEGSGEEYCESHGNDLVHPARCP